MTELPDKKELEQLKTFQEPYCLSVYVPSPNPNDRTNHARIELKNILRQAETALRSAGQTSLLTTKTLKPAIELAGKQEFWPPRSEALALLLHPDFYMIYHLPDGRVRYQLTVAKGFNIEPIEKVLKNNHPYLLLTLSHKNVKLYEGDYFGLEPLWLKRWPRDLEKTLSIDEYPNWLETHTVAPARTGKGSEGFHGQYNIRETDKQMLEAFFRRIDKRLHKLLRRRKLPLVIAGVGYLFPIYRRVNTSPYLTATGISGNFEQPDLKELRERAWTIVDQGGQDES